MFVKRCALWNKLLCFWLNYLCLSLNFSPWQQDSRLGLFRSVVTNFMCSAWTSGTHCMEWFYFLDSLLLSPVIPCLFGSFHIWFPPMFYRWLVKRGTCPSCRRVVPVPGQDWLRERQLAQEWRNNSYLQKWTEYTQSLSPVCIIVRSNHLRRVQFFCNLCYFEAWVQNLCGICYVRWSCSLFWGVNIGQVEIWLYLNP